VDVIANWLWQGSIVTLLTIASLRLLNRGPSQLRYLVCWAGLSGVLLLPLISLVPHSLRPLPALNVESQLLADIVSVPEAPTWLSPFLMLWGLWLFMHVLQVAVATEAGRRRRTRCAPFPQKLERRLRHWLQVKGSGRRTQLVVSDDVRAAAVIGCSPPVIAVAPALIQHLTADELDRVVIHEWAHVQRRDDLANVAQLTARAVAGWHPAVWWLDRRLKAERETACDEMVVTLTGSSRAYAACLVKLAGLVLVSRKPLPALGVLSSTHLASRVQKIVSAQDSTQARWSMNVARVAIALLLGTSLAIGSLRFGEAAIASSELAALRGVLHSRPLQTSIEIPAAIKPSVSRKLSPVYRRPSTPDRVATTPAPQMEITTAESSAHTVPTDAAPHPVEIVAENPPPLETLPATPLKVPQVQQGVPWTAAANAGVALGQRSKKGGLATAAFFTRLGKRVADSF
jgi:bla regulator protein blaR1